MGTYQQTALWQIAFAARNDGFDPQRQTIVEAYKAFRERVALLLQQIQRELPALTLHDITHVDALWRVASEIAGKDYVLNPAEALVLGGAFLLHDAAHCRAAFPGGIDELRKTTEWQDSAAQRGIDSEQLTEGTTDFQAVLFDTLRALHPRQARNLPFARWSDGAGNTLNLFPHDELREAFGHLMGEIAESHWFHPHELEVFANRPHSAPACLAPANWMVDPLKIAVLLRVADAAHIDAKRAPRLLLAMNWPERVSREHWLFQARLNQPACDSQRGELIISGNPFPVTEQAAWWLAYDAANLAHRELIAADHLLRDHRIAQLAAREVAGAHSPDTFARRVPTQGWHPVDTSLHISDVQSVVERFGGEKLYGNEPHLALRELLQNARDAIHACRRLGYLNDSEGEIEVAVEDAGNGHWLHVTDTGIGMSRYVLTEVLLDFGRSLWSSRELRGEWAGLAASGFEAIGQFGIGFFSVFMLGKQVKVCTHRYDAKDGEKQNWLLEFTDGTAQRPLLREPVGTEKLRRHGTRVSVLIAENKLSDLLPELNPWRKDSVRMTLSQLCGYLAPALDIDLYVQQGTENRKRVVQANDWLTLPAFDLLERLDPRNFDDKTSRKFGPWSHLTELKNRAGETVGRCAVKPKNLLGPREGMGVVKGLLANQVEGIYGVVIAKAQTSLARNDAIPDIELSDLQRWAEGQRVRLKEIDELSKTTSAPLAHFGASFDDLVIGHLGDHSITYEELIEKMKPRKVLAIHKGEIEHDDDDDVLYRDFYDWFEASDDVLQLPKDSPPRWLQKIDTDGELTPEVLVTIKKEMVGASADASVQQHISVRTLWSLEFALESAITQAWGTVEWTEEDDFVVGNVNGHEITRKCRIATKPDSESED